MEAQLNHAFDVIRETFGTGMGMGRGVREEAARRVPAPFAPPGASDSDSEVVVAVARTDASPAELMRAIEKVLRAG